VLKCHYNLSHSLVLKILTMFRLNLIIFLRGMVNRSTDNRGFTVYVFFYSIEQHSRFCYMPYRCSICAPFVIPRTSTRQSSSFQTVCSMSANPSLR
jgi:hypothetical protein